MGKPILLSKRQIRDRAVGHLADRRLRNDAFPDVTFGDHSWDILLILILFIAELDERAMIIADLYRESSALETTLLRHISALEAKGMVGKRRDKADARFRYIRLTDKGSAAMDRWVHAEFDD
ncbi:MarR family winged helix-turn-helix transcriptional regulator [Novosphingopyxis iocasae]|uniref:MarR family winged helix-turn-helix transcriptional regulator n=1 Tax=Novosphingopyxis iocasae TaxID=2762729 RepID=UPI001650FA5E|nr:MarR family winged helix-turn-helix transcriptional regulator [Novosphingopyxis iocasae]